MEIIFNSITKQLSEYIERASSDKDQLEYFSQEVIQSTLRDLVGEQLAAAQEEVAKQIQSQLFGFVLKASEFELLQCENAALTLTVRTQEQKLTTLQAEHAKMSDEVCNNLIELER